MTRKPTQQEITEDLKRKLTGGEFKPGERLPAERRLASDYGVSTLTIRCALAELAGQGWLTRRRGSGTYVCMPPATATPGHAEIAVIFADKYQHYPLLLQTITEIMKAANRRGVNPRVYAYPQGEIHLEAGVLHQDLSGGRVAGILALSTLADEELAYLMQFQDRTVLFGNLRRDADIGVVWPDADVAASLAAGHLHELGHSRIGLVNGVGGDDLHEGFRRTLSVRRLNADACSEQPWSEEGGRQGLIDLLSSGNRPTSVLAGDEYLTLGVMHQAMEAGLRIPEDLSVISMSDRLPPETYPVQPTAIRIDYAAMAEVSMDMLFSAVPLTTRVIMPSLVIRDSTANPKPTP